jgi:hypothetical protein
VNFVERDESRCFAVRAGHVLARQDTQPAAAVAQPQFLRQRVDLGPQIGITGDKLPRQVQIIGRLVLVRGDDEAAIAQRRPAHEQTVEPCEHQIGRLPILLRPTDEYKIVTRPSVCPDLVQCFAEEITPIRLDRVKQRLAVEPLESGEELQRGRVALAAHDVSPAMSRSRNDNGLADPLGSARRFTFKSARRCTRTTSSALTSTPRSIFARRSSAIETSSAALVTAAASSTVISRPAATSVLVAVREGNCRGCQVGERSYGTAGAGCAAPGSLPAGLPDWRRHLLTDPQTSGGLLVACEPDRAEGMPAPGRVGEM